MDACAVCPAYGEGWSGIWSVVSIPSSVKTIELDVVKEDAHDGGVRVLIMPKDKITGDLLSETIVTQGPHHISCVIPDTYKSQQARIQIEVVGAGNIGGCPCEGPCCSEYVGINKVSII